MANTRIAFSIRAVYSRSHYQMLMTWLLCICLLCSHVLLLAQNPDSIYLLGPGDKISLYAVDAEELSGKTFLVGSDGFINVPLAGQVKASAKTVGQLKDELTARLTKYIKEPQLQVSIVEMKSKPVSILGAVNAPGVQQLQGPTTIIQAITQAGGFSKEAGHYVTITRLGEWGHLPLLDSSVDSRNGISKGRIDVKTLVESRNPEENIILCPNDVVSVAKAQLVYVIGEVRKAGGFTLGEQSNISLLQALALAEGPTSTAAPGNARILRTQPGLQERQEIPINLKKILAGKSPDVSLSANDILFIPDNTSRKAAIKIAEATVQTLSGLIIWRGL